MKYLHMDLGDGKVTAAYKMTDGNEGVDFTLAFCSPGDQFSRKVGRAIAGGRQAKYGPAYSILLDDSEPPDKQIRAYVARMLKNGSTRLPRWTR